MGRRRAGRAREHTSEDDSGLIDLNALGALDPHGDATSGLQRKAAIGRLDAPVLQPIVLPAERKVSLTAVAVVLSGAALATAAVLIALMLREGDVAQAPALAPAVMPAAAAVAGPAERAEPSAAQVLGEGARLAAAAQAKQASTKPALPEAPRPAAPDSGHEVADETDDTDETDDSGRERSKRAKRDLPPKPTRAGILSAMSRVQGRIRACGNGHSGVVRLDMVINGPRGRVRSVAAKGAPSRIGRCIESAAKRARFTPFADRHFEIRYPMKF